MRNGLLIPSFTLSTVSYNYNGICTASNYKTTETDKDFYYLYSGARQGWLGMQAAMRFFFNSSSSATISIIASTLSLDTPIISAMQKIASFSFSSRPSFVVRHKTQNSASTMVMTWEDIWWYNELHSNCIYQNVQVQRKKSSPLMQLW